VAANKAGLNSRKQIQIDANIQALPVTSSWRKSSNSRGGVFLFACICYCNC